MRYHETSEEVILKGGWAWSGLVLSFGLNGRALAAFFSFVLYHIHVLAFGLKSVH